MTDSRYVADGLLSLDRHALTVILAGQDCMRTLGIIRQKARERWDRDAAAHALLQASARYEPYSEAELRLILWMRCTDFLELVPRLYRTQDDWRDAADELATKAVQMRRAQEKAFVGTSLQDLTADVLRQLFESVGERPVEQTPEEQARLASSVRDYLDSLPADQQARVRAALGAEELSDEVVKKAVASGTLWAALAGTVGVMGFGAYTGAVSLLHLLASLIGVTLPFSAYAGLTSLIAVLHNPLFIVFLLGGGGWWMVARSDRKIRERMMPVLAVQLALAGLEGDPEGRREQNAGEMADRFSAEASSVAGLLRDHADWGSLRAKEEEQTRTCEAQAKPLKERVRSLSATIRARAVAIADELMERPDELDRHRHVPPLAEAIRGLSDLRAQEARRAEAKSARATWWTKTVGAAGDAWVGARKWDQESSLARKLASMAPSDLRDLSLTGWLADQVAQLVPIGESLMQAKGELLEVQARRDDHRRKVGDAEARQRDALRRVSEAESVYPRLSDHAKVLMAGG